jgi:OOP family OmpA-OmpF porin
MLFAGIMSVGSGAGAQSQLRILEPWQTVLLEHADRKNRLDRLSHLEGVEPPETSEYYIPPFEHGLASYPTDIPVLRVVFRDGVLFDFNSDEVKPEAAELLNVIAKSLRLEPPDVAVFVAGHTDAIGSVNYNLDLGLRRAKSVARALAQIGVNKAQLFAVSFGKAVPIAPNDTDEGRARNRRVEFLFAARAEAVAAWLVRQPAMSCSDRRSSYAQECPTDLRFTVLSVTIPMPPPGHVALRDPSTSINISPAISPVPLTAPRTTVKFGEKVIDIDLRQKVFHFRAPE